MSTLLYHEVATGGVIATPGGRIRGEAASPRIYHHSGHFVEIDGPAYIIAHDVEEICKIAGYRLATPAENDMYYGRKRQESSVQEENSDEDEPIAEKISIAEIGKRRSK